jgi:predicted ribosomally synthesized peptide with SipW-like signal peptide
LTLMVLGVLMLALLIGGLYGYFDDTETSTGNVFTAGTLNLVSEIDGVGYSDISEGLDGINDNITFGMVAPGESGSITWTLTNDGTVDGELTLVCTDNVFGENGSNEPELAVFGNDSGGNGDLDEYMTCQLSCEGTYITNGGISGYVPFSDLAAALNSQANVALGAGLDTVYLLEWQIDSSVGNIIQSDTANIGITFTLTQV